MKDTCLICGHVGHDVRVFVVRWAEPVDGKIYGAIPRCLDRDACRERCRLIGEPWPLEEATVVRP